MNLPARHGKQLPMLRGVLPAVASPGKCARKAKGVPTASPSRSGTWRPAGGEGRAAGAGDG